MKLTRDTLKQLKIDVKEKQGLVNLIDDKKSIVATLPLFYANPTSTYRKNVKSAFLWVQDNKALYNKMVKAIAKEPLATISILETFATDLHSQGKTEWLQAFKSDTFTFKYSICLLFGIPQGRIDKVKDANGTSNKTSLKDIVSDENCIDITKAIVEAIA